MAGSFQSTFHTFNVVRRQDLYVVAILLGMGATFGSLLWLIRDGASLAAFPQAMLIGKIVFILVCYLFLAYLVRKDRQP